MKKNGAPVPVEQARTAIEEYVVRTDALYGDPNKEETLMSITTKMIADLRLGGILNIGPIETSLKDWESIPGQVQHEVIRSLNARLVHLRRQANSVFRAKWEYQQKLKAEQEAAEAEAAAKAALTPEGIQPETDFLGGNGQLGARTHELSQSR